MRTLLRFKDSSRYINLLFWILVILAIYPYLNDTRQGSIVLALGSTLVMLAALFAAQAHRRNPWVARIMGIVYFVIMWIDVFTARGAIDAVAVLASILFYVTVIVAILRDVLSHRTVVKNTLSGAVCVYLLLGFAWSGAYWLVEFLQPGAYRFPDGVEVLRWTDFLYFSYTTLTTLGYGDITPLDDHARSLTSLEAICGAMYVALLISRLVAGYQAEGATRPADGETGEG